MSLRRKIKVATGQDVFQCQGCQECNLPHLEEQDIPLGSLIQLISMDDDEALTCLTLWSDRVLEECKFACKKKLDIPAILLALRAEAKLRGLV